MSESSKRRRKLPKKIVDMPDDEMILRFFPKRLVDALNRLIDHEPKHRPSRKKDTS